MWMGYNKRPIITKYFTINVMQNTSDLTFYLINL